MITRRGMVLAIAAALIVGCAIGLITGVLFARAALSLHGPNERAMRHGPREHGVAMRFVQRRLDLSDEQAGRIEAIVERARDGSDSLHARAHAEILALLTPEQRTRFERINRRMFGGRGRPHAGHPGRGSGRPPHEGPDDE